MVDRSTGELRMKYEVKIPKIINIQKDYLYEHLEQFLRDIICKIITGEEKWVNIFYLSYVFYCDKLGIKHNMMYTRKQSYERQMIEYKKQFKDSSFRGYDYVIIIDKLEEFAEKITNLLDEIKLIYFGMSVDDKLKLMYDKITGENT